MTGGTIGEVCDPPKVVENSLGDLHAEVVAGAVPCLLEASRKPTTDPGPRWADVAIGDAFDDTSVPTAEPAPAEEAIDESVFH